MSSTFGSSSSSAYDAAVTRAPAVDLALGILRIVIGIIFVVHGAQKVFVFGHAGVTGFFTQAGIPLPPVSGFVVTWLELLGGLALVLGIFTQTAAALIAIEMVGAILFVHLKNGFFNPMGIEYPLTLLTANIALALAGPGAYALDRMRGARRSP